MTFAYHSSIIVDIQNKTIHIKMEKFIRISFNQQHTLHVIKLQAFILGKKFQILRSSAQKRDKDPSELIYFNLQSSCGGSESKRVF
jgi:frataxin-like iron-binding protein CyaY